MTVIGMTTENLIEYMREHGSSLILNWGEDTAVWEVAWITGGKRFCGFSKNLGAALSEAHAKALDALIESSRAKRLKGFTRGPVG